MINELDSDSHAIFGPASDHEHGEEEGPEPFGGRSFENFSFVGRTAYENDATEGQHMQFGVSVAYAPEAVQFVEPMMGNVLRLDSEVAIFGFDAAYQWRDPVTRRGYSLGTEILHIRNEFVPDGATAVSSANATGFYLYGEHFVDAEWSLGASGGWFEHAEDDSESSWDAGLFSTWQVNDNNRLRFEARHFDDPDQDYWGLTVQWTIFFGPHNHGTPGIWH